MCSKLERARDLFEQALDKCPSDVSAQIFLLYAKLEEEHGLMRNAMAIYQRAVEAVASKLVNPEPENVMSVPPWMGPPVGVTPRKELGCV